MRGEIDRIGAYGVRNAEIGEPIDAQILFEAASLGKPVVAHALLQLVDDGKLDLEQPLSQLVGPLVPDDPASASLWALISGREDGPGSADRITLEPPRQRGVTFREIEN